MLLAGLESVCIVKNFALGLEKAALGLRPRAAFSRPWSQFFTIQTSQPANNVYVFPWGEPNSVGASLMDGTFNFVQGKGVRQYFSHPQVV